MTEFGKILVTPIKHTGLLPVLYKANSHIEEKPVHTRWVSQQVMGIQVRELPRVWRSNWEQKEYVEPDYRGARKPEARTSISGARSEIQSVGQSPQSEGQARYLRDKIRSPVRAQKGRAKLRVCGQAKSDSQTTYQRARRGTI